MSKLHRAALSLALIALGAPAFALVIDARDFAPGTVVSNAVPGLTLSHFWVHVPDGAPVELRKDPIYSVPFRCEQDPADFHSPMCGQRVFGHTEQPTGGSFLFSEIDRAIAHYVDAEPLGPDWMWWSLLRVDLDEPATQLSYLGGHFGIGDHPILALFLDQGGEFVGFGTDTGRCETFTSGNDVLYTCRANFLLDAPFQTVLIGSSGGAFVQRVSIGEPLPVPTSHSIVVLALGLVAVALRGGVRKLR
jgi:hypothetical protein